MDMHQAGDGPEMDSEFDEISPRHTTLTVGEIRMQRLTDLIRMLMLTCDEETMPLSEIQVAGVEAVAWLAGDDVSRDMITRERLHAAVGTLLNEREALIGTHWLFNGTPPAVSVLGLQKQVAALESLMAVQNERATREIARLQAQVTLYAEAEPRRKSDCGGLDIPMYTHPWQLKLGPLPYVVVGEWVDPSPVPWDPARDHPYDPAQAWLVLDEGRRLAFPNRDAAAAWCNAMGRPFP